MAEQGGETKVTPIKPAQAASANRVDVPGWQVKTTHLARIGHRFTPAQVAHQSMDQGEREVAQALPRALVWCIRKPGRDLQDKVELWLAWQKVRSEIDAGTMGPEFERPELNAVSQQIRSAEEEAVEEVKASYRQVRIE